VRASDRGAAIILSAQERWSRIVARLVELVDAYNAAFDTPVLTILPPSAKGEATTIVIAASHPLQLQATVDETLISVITRDSDGIARRDFALNELRSDAATAAYILQPWMERL